MKFTWWQWIIILVGGILLGNALHNASQIERPAAIDYKPVPRTDPRQACNWMYDKINFNNVGRGGVDREIARNTEVTAWATLYMACLERYR